MRRLSDHEIKKFISRFNNGDKDPIPDNVLDTETVCCHCFGLTRSKFIQTDGFIKSLSNSDKDVQNYMTPLTWIIAYRLSWWKAMWELPNGKGLYALMGRDIIFIPRYTADQMLRDTERGGVGGQWIFANPIWRNDRYNEFIHGLRKSSPKFRRNPLTNATMLATFLICDVCCGMGKYDWITKTHPTNTRKIEDDMTQPDQEGKFQIHAVSSKEYIKKPFAEDAEEICTACGGTGVDMSRYVCFANGHILEKDRPEMPEVWFNFSSRLSYVASPVKRTLEIDKRGGRRQLEWQI